MTNEETRRNIRRMIERWFACPKYYARMLNEINGYKEKLESVTDIKPQCLTGMPRGNEISNPTERAAERLATLKEHFADEIDYLSTEIERTLDLDMQVKQCVQSLEPIEQTIIELRYRSSDQNGGKTYEQIAREIGYSEDHVKRLERVAIDKLSLMILIEIK